MTFANSEIKRLSDTNKQTLINNLQNNLKGKIAPIRIRIDTVVEQNIIIEYQTILSNMNNNFVFNIVSDESYKILETYILTVLKPPLIKIKEDFDEVENIINNNLKKTINNFPDYFIILKELLDYDIVFNIDNEIKETNKLILNYTSNLDDNFNDFLNEIVHYTYIDGILFISRRCTHDSCDSLIYINSIKDKINKIIRRLENINEN